MFNLYIIRNDTEIFGNVSFYDLEVYNLGFTTPYSIMSFPVSGLLWKNDYRFIYSATRLLVFEMELDSYNTEVNFSICHQVREVY